MTAPHLAEITRKVVKLALDQGATDAEATAAEGDEFEVSVRLGEVETLKESGSRGVGVRVLFNRNTGSSYTSDFTDEGLNAMVRQAVELAKITTEDPYAGLPDPEDLGQFEGDLQLFYDDVANLPAETKIDLARRAEKAALEVDPRINNSEGGSFGSHISRSAFSNSRGFTGSYATTSCSLSAVPVAQDGERMERDYWYSVARSAAKLESPEVVGRKAAANVLRRLNPRKVPTQKANIVFDPRMARSLIGHIFEAVNGDSVYRKASFLHDKLGQKIAGDNITVIDDSTLPGLFGSSPFDDEGVPARRTVIIENGVLKSFLLNTYTGRKLGLKSTASASRGITGNASVGHGNLFLENGTLSMEQLLAQAGTGFYITELMGSGVNAVTGDYSRGASGLWIEDGKLTFPVSEVTIAGNLKDMLNSVEAIANDLEFQGSVAAPTLLIGGMTISGQ